MRRIQTWMTGTTLAVAACTSEQTPTGPGEALAPASPAAAVANTWTALSPHNFAGRTGVSAGAAADGRKVFAHGGIDGDGGIASFLFTYTPATDTWGGQHITTPTLLQRFGGNGLGIINGKVYIAGGYVDDDGGVLFFSRQLHVYDPVARTLTRKADMPRGLAEGVVGVFDGKLYLLPGQCDANLWPQPGQCPSSNIRRLYRYNPATNRWAARAMAPHHHRNGAAGFIGGKFYVVGGRRPSGMEASLDVYDPATDTWVTRAPIPTAGPAIGTALAGKLYVVVGTKAYVYTPATNKWAPIAAPANAGHQALVRVVVGGMPRLLAFGGHLASGQAAPSELYTP
jgi:N-acetylneuraminic acid mutarotase